MDVYETSDEFNLFLDDNFKLLNGDEEINVDSISRMIFEYDIELYKELLTEWMGDDKEKLKKCFENLICLPDNNDRFEELLGHFSHSQVVPFVGAGLSIACGAPGWTQFLASLKGQVLSENHALFEEYLNSYKLVELAQLIHDSLGADGFSEKIDRAFDRDYDIVGALGILPRLSFDHILTTNFDRILEKSFEKRKVRIDDITRGSNTPDRLVPGRLTLTKIHGDFNYTSSRVFLKEEYKRAYYNNSGEIDLSLGLPKLLGKIYLNRTILFLGCSLEIDSTLDVFKRVKQSNKDKKFRHFAIHAFIEEDDKRIARERFLNDHGIFPIWFSGGDYDGIEAILLEIKKRVG